MWILTNLKTVAAVLATAILAYALHAMAAGLTESRHEAAMADQAALYVTQCEAAQKLTQEVSNEYQTKLRAVNARHADAVHRLLAHESAKHPSAAPGGRDAAPGGGGLPDAHAGAAQQLLSLAAVAERQAQQLIACQDYLSKAR